MLEDIKLNLFKNNLAGFAYEISYGQKNGYILQIYLVVGNENNYKFIKFRKSNFLYESTMNSIIQTMNDYGYIPLSKWIEMGKNNKTIAK